MIDKRFASDKPFAALRAAAEAAKDNYAYRERWDDARLNFERLATPKNILALISILEYHIEKDRSQ